MSLLTEVEKFFYYEDDLTNKISEWAKDRCDTFVDEESEKYEHPQEINGINIIDFYTEVKKEYEASQRSSRSNAQNNFASVLLGATSFHAFCDMMRDVRKGDDVVFCPPLICMEEDEEKLDCDEFRADSKNDNDDYDDREKEMSYKDNDDYSHKLPSITDVIMETSDEKIAALVTKLNKTFKTGKTLSAEWRYAQLLAMQRLVKENAKDIQHAINTDLGRSFFESEGLDILPFHLEIQHAINNLKDWMKPTFTKMPAIAAPATSEIRYEPLGVVLIIAPFNYPFYLTLGPLIGAIAAGNCSMIKPSELTKCTEAIILKLIPQYMDNDAVAVVTGAIKTTTSLLNQKWDKIFFTGSTRVGKVVAQAAAKHLTPVALELGGKSPTIIDKSVTNMDLVAKRILWGKLVNSGQTCIAPDYVLCHQSKHKEFLEAAVKCLKTFYGDDVQKSKDFARIVSPAHCERLKGLLEGNPGKIITGGKVDVADRYCSPTIVDCDSVDSKLMIEEIFGPILPVLKYESIDKAIEMINSENLQKPLALYIFSKDRQLIDKVIDEVPSGGVVVNDTIFHVLNPYIPFGGVGGSGRGGYHGFYSYEGFSHRRSIMRRDDQSVTDAPFRYPPYSRMNLTLFQTAATLPDLPSITGTTFCLGFLAVSVAVSAAVNFSFVATVAENLLKTYNASK